MLIRGAHLIRWDQPDQIPEGGAPLLEDGATAVTERARAMRSSSVSKLADLEDQLAAREIDHGRSLTVR